MSGFLTKRQLASKLACSPRTVERHVRPVVRVGGQNRYTLEDALAQLAGVPDNGGNVIEFPTRGGKAA